MIRDVIRARTVTCPIYRQQCTKIPSEDRVSTTTLHASNSSVWPLQGDMKGDGNHVEQ